MGSEGVQAAERWELLPSSSSSLQQSSRGRHDSKSWWCQDSSGSRGDGSTSIMFGV